MVKGVPQNSLHFSFAISPLKLYQGISSLTFFNRTFHWLLKIVQHFNLIILRLFCCSSCWCCLYCCCGSVFCSCSYCVYLLSIKVNLALFKDTVAVVVALSRSPLPLYHAKSYVAPPLYLIILERTWYRNV